MSIKDTTKQTATPVTPTQQTVKPSGTPRTAVEADLLCREEHADETSLPRLSRFAGHAARVHWRKATGLTAGDVMTVPALTVGADWTLPKVAREFARTGVRRLFVVDGDRLAGVVARRDVLRPFLRGDREIEHEIDTEVFGAAVHAKPSVRVAVEDGGSHCSSAGWNIRVTSPSRPHSPGRCRVSSRSATV